MLKRALLIALAAGSVLAVAAPPARARAAAGFHRGPYGRCLPNRGPGPRGPVVGVGPGGLIIGNYYEGRGYWDGRRYWHNRERWRGGWRYR
jgi:hypothetical protein